MSSRPDVSNAINGTFAARAMGQSALSEAAFRRMISIERRRTARSRKSFLLMLVDMGEHFPSNQHPNLHKVLSALSLVLRETDVTGWYKEGSVLGVMFTEINFDADGSIPATIMKRVSHTLKSHLTPRVMHQVSLSFHFVPGPQERELSPRNPNPAIYPSASRPTGTETST